MKFTMITDANASYFETAIGDLYAEQRRDRLFFGVIDDTDRNSAAGAVAFTIMGKTLMIDTIGVEVRKRKRGFGRFLLSESARFAAENGFERIAASFYETRKEIEKNEFARFFRALGFQLESAPMERKIYLLSDLYREEGRLSVHSKERFEFVKGAELTEPVRRELLRLSMLEEGGISYLNEDLLFSEENRYGGVVLENGEPLAAAAILPFEDGVRSDQLYGRLDELAALRFLLASCLEKIKQEPELLRLYMDIGGEKLIRFQTQIFQKADIPCESCLQGYMAVKAVSPIEDQGLERNR